MQWTGTALALLSSKITISS